MLINVIGHGDADSILKPVIQGNREERRRYARFVHNRSDTAVCPKCYTLTRLYADKDAEHILCEYCGHFIANVSPEVIKPFDFVKVIDKENNK